MIRYDAQMWIRKHLWAVAVIGVVLGLVMSSLLGDVLGLLVAFAGFAVVAPAMAARSRKHDPRK